MYNTVTSECKTMIFVYEGLDPDVEPDYGRATEFIATASTCCTAGTWLFYRSQISEEPLPDYITSADAE